MMGYDWLTAPRVDRLVAFDFSARHLDPLGDVDPDLVAQRAKWREEAAMFCGQANPQHLGEVSHATVEVRMLQITVTVSADHEKVMEEARKLEREGFAKIQEQLPNLTLNVPEQRNESMVIESLARLARKGSVTKFESKWIK